MFSNSCSAQSRFRQIDIGIENELGGPCLHISIHKVIITLVRSKIMCPEKKESSKGRRFHTADGHMTRSIQAEYMKKEVTDGRMPKRAFEMEDIMSLQAPTEPSFPLYFWQIFSLTGRSPLLELSKVFYTNVFQDEDEWFSSSFGRPDVTNHAMFLSLALVDCFGGGRYYAGGERRLDDVHETAASPVMNLEAAIKWTQHMRQAMDQQSKVFDEIDPRIRPAMNSYFTFFMSRYAAMFNFDMKQISFGDKFIPSWDFVQK